MTDDADVVIVGYGIVSRVVRSAVELLRQEGIKAGMVRPITLWPYPKAVLRQAGRPGEVLPGVRDVDGADGRGRAALGRRASGPVYFYGRSGGNVPTPAEVVAAVKQRM